MKSTLLAVTLFAAATSAPAQVEHVDPTIGGVGLLLQPTRPTVHLPNSMVRMYPVRSDQLDDRIRSFPLTIISHRLGELFALMPGAAEGPRLGTRKSQRHITIPRGLTSHSSVRSSRRLNAVVISGSPFRMGPPPSGWPICIPG